MEGAFRELATEVAKRGARLVILQPPTQSAYVGWLEGNAAGVLTDYRNALSSLRDEGIEIVVWEFPEEVGLSNEAFSDYGHLRSDAAIHFTAVVAERLWPRSLGAASE
jgi:hypothetical protein